MESNRKNINKNIESLFSLNDNLKSEERLITKITSIFNSVIYAVLVGGVKVYCSVYDSKNRIIGYVNSLRERDIEIFLTVSGNGISYYDDVYVSNDPIYTSFHSGMVGSVVDAFGNLIMSFVERDDFQHEEKIPIFEDAPSIKERGHLNSQLFTGYNSIDMMYPVGHGQRMLVIGDRKTLKTTVALNVIKTARDNDKLLKREKDSLFIYVSIGQRAVDLARSINTLVENETLDNVIVVAASSSEPLGLQFISPYAAMSIADKYARSGLNVCVFIDDVSKHALAHREICLLAGKIPGRESFQGDIFYMHSSMLERSLKYKSGGSVTCFPFVESTNGEISGYISTNIISITDGQIFLSKSLLNEDLLPPVSYTVSVSRTGSSVQHPLMKKVIGSCKRSLSFYSNLIDFYRMYRSDCDTSVKQRIKDGLIIINILYKINSSNFNILKQFICIGLILKKDELFASIPIDKIELDSFSTTLLNYLSILYSELVEDEEILDLIKNESSNSSLIIEKIEKSILNNAFSLDQDNSLENNEETY